MIEVTLIDGLRASYEVDGAKALEYAWAAGVLEGEGCFAIFRRSDRRSTTGVAIHCEMTDEDVVLRLREVFGVGTIHLRPNVAGRRDARNRKPTWIWSVQNHAGIAEVILRVGIHLCERRRAKAAELLAHIEDRGLFDA